MQDTDSDRVLDDDERQHVNHALQAILATEKFEAAPQMSAFLRYVVEQASEGNQSRIKAFTVAVDALGKPETFDPQNDPVVRVLAGRLRATLTAYNEEHPNAPVKITMTKGSYVPEFHRQQSAATHPDRTDVPNAAKGKFKNTIATNAEPLPTHSNDPDKASSRTSTEPSQVRVSTSEPANEPPAVAAGIDANGVNFQNTSQVTSQATSNGSSGFAVDASTMSRIAQAVDAIPRHLYIALFLAVVTMTVLTSLASGRGTSQMQYSDAPASVAERDRPDSPSIFVSAIDQGVPLENSLNTLVSSVISETTDLGVYRILNRNQNIQYWPEDYLLELATLNLSNKVRVHLQLIEALTGRIIHAEEINLNERDSDQFSSDELAVLIEATRSIIIEKGPLLQHYSQRTASK